MLTRQWALESPTAGGTAARRKEEERVQHVPYHLLVSRVGVFYLFFNVLFVIEDWPLSDGPSFFSKVLSDCTSHLQCLWGVVWTLENQQLWSSQDWCSQTRDPCSLTPPRST